MAALAAAFLLTSASVALAWQTAMTVSTPPTSLVTNASFSWGVQARANSNETITQALFTFPKNVDVSGATVALTMGGTPITPTSVTTSTVGGTVTITLNFTATGGQAARTFVATVSNIRNPSVPGTYNYQAVFTDSLNQQTTPTPLSQPYAITANTTAPSLGTIVPADPSYSAVTTYTVPVVVGAQGRLASDATPGGTTTPNTITVTFPAGFVVPASAAAGSVTINGTPLTAAPTFAGQAVTVQIPAGVTVPNGGTASVVFGSSFGLANPAAPGSYTLSATTSAETGTGTSASFAIDAGPTATIASPAAGAWLTGGAATISGTASDGLGSGVNHVDLMIQRSDGQYWTGTGWSGVSQWVAAAGTTSWSYNWGPLPAEDGAYTYTVTARATDNVNVFGPTASVAGVRIDNVAPTGSIVINGNATYATSLGVTLTLSGTDAGSGMGDMRFSNDGASWSTWEPYATTKGWTLSGPDGANTVYVQYDDALGNVSGSFSDTIVLDRVAPTTSRSDSIAPNGKAGWYTVPPAVTLTADEAGAITEYAWDAAALSPYLGALTPAEGTHTLSYRSTDLAGNAEITKSWGYKVDTLPPGTPAAAASNVTASSLDLSWGAVSDASSGVDYYEIYDGASLVATTTSSTRTFTGLAPNSSHTYTVRALDVAGNPGVASAPVNVTLGLNPAPVTTASATPPAPNGNAGWYRTSPSIVLSSDAGAVIHYQWDSSSGAWTTYSVAVAPADGTHTLYFYATKTGSNAEVTKSYGPLKVDTAAPGTPSVTPSNVTANSVDLSWAAVVDVTSGIDFYEIYDGASVVATTAATSRTMSGLSPNSAHAYTVRAIDVAGNPGAASPVVNVTTALANAPTTTPAISPPSPDGTAGWYVTPPLITLTSDMPGFTYYSWVSNSGPWTTYASFVTGIAGTHSLYYYSTSPGSSDETTKTFGPVKVDLADPGTPSVSASGVTPISVNLSWAAVADTDSGVDFYRIYDGASLIATTSATSRTVSGLTPGSSHSYTVQAVDVAGRVGAASTAVPVTTSLNGPPTTTLTKTPAAADGSAGWYVSIPVLTLDGGAGATTYYQWDSASAGGWTLYTAPFAAIAGTHTLHFYSTKSGSTDESPKDSGPIKVDVAAPSTPAPAASNVTGSSATISWAAATDVGSGIANYVVYDSLNNVVVSTASTSTTISGLTGSTSYTYRVRAFDAAGNPSGYGPVTFTTTAVAQPFQYSVTIPASGGGTNVTLDFSSVTTTPTTSATHTAPRQAVPAAGLVLVGSNYFDITADPVYSGFIEVTIPYSEADLNGATESGLTMWHYKTGVGWENITISVDTANNRITGRTTSFSDFAVYAPTGPQPPVSGVPASSGWTIGLLALAGVGLLGTGMKRRGFGRG